MQSLVVPGSLDSLEKLGKYILLAAKNAGLEKARTYKLRLAVDEIATNIINYGYQRAGLVGVITIKADLDEHALTITLVDTAGPYDPTLRPPPPPEYFTMPLEERDIGGWGVYLAIQSVDQFHYQRIQDQNHNSFVMYRATHGELLVIDSSQRPVSDMAEYLTGLGYAVMCVEDGQKARDLLQQQKFEMILLALPVQDTSAEEFIKGMKADNALRNIPLLVLAAADQLDEAERCVKSGAEDYIVLPFRPTVLKSRISANLERQRVRISEKALKDSTSTERDVQIGQQIQVSFFPEKLPQLPGWEVAARFEPARQVAGDFYDSFVLPNHHVSLIVGDVSGNGIPAALFMVLFRSFLRAFSQQDQSDRRTGPTPARQDDVLSADRLALKNAIELTNGYILHNHASTNMFATIFYGILDPDSGAFVYINAGHEPPLILHQGKVKTTLKRTGVAIGVLLESAYEIQQAQLDPGDTLLIVTDGVINARNPSGQSFGRKGLLDLLSEPGLSAPALLSRIETNLRTHLGDSPQDDDVTLLAARRTA